MEIHQIISAESPGALLKAEREFISRHAGYSVSLKRYFLSSREQKATLEAEASHSEQALPSTASPYAVSYVIQPVLGPGAIAVWLFLTKDYPVELIWRTNLIAAPFGAGPESGSAPKTDSAAQTTAIFETYESDLAQAGLRIADDCVRTWLYVDDIDINYAGVVKARRENFEREGLTPATHYLASTGIFGGSVVPGAVVQMDALAIKGSFTQHYLYAPQNFCLTHEYGVTFERGVVLEYGGQSHVLISGTASINNKGEIVHPGDVCAQTQRMLLNVESLLTEAGCTWPDVKMMVVYLRNAADYPAVAAIFGQQFGNGPAQGRTPYVITHAPVCRPGWLIEMECIAVK